MPKIPITYYCSGCLNAMKWEPAKDGSDQLHLVCVTPGCNREGVVEGRASKVAEPPTRIQ